MEGIGLQWSLFEESWLGRQSHVNKENIVNVHRSIFSILVTNVCPGEVDDQVAWLTPEQLVCVYGPP